MSKIKYTRRDGDTHPVTFNYLIANMAMQITEDLQHNEKLIFDTLFYGAELANGDLEDKIVNQMIKIEEEMRVFQAGDPARDLLARDFQTLNFLDECRHELRKRGVAVMS